MLLFYHTHQVYNPEIIDLNYLALVGNNSATIAPEHLVDFACQNQGTGLSHTTEKGLELQRQMAITRIHLPGFKRYDNGRNFFRGGYDRP